MIDTTSEQLLPLVVLARDITNRTGRRGINVATLWRWCMKPNRHGVRLESVIVGGLRMSSREALSRYIATTTAAADGTPPMPPTPKQRAKAIEQAERELTAAGI